MAAQRTAEVVWEGSLLEGAGTVRDPVHVDVERARRRRMQLQLESGLLTSFAECSRLQRRIGLLDVTPGLQQLPELLVRHETDALARFVDHERRGGEMGRSLVAGERFGELLREAQHRAPVGLLARIAGDVDAKNLDDFGHSYCSASRMFRRDARLAGKIAARMPTKIAASAKTISETMGSEKTMKSTL